MRPPLRLLLEQVIDYAGLFPPAKLDMADALREFRAHKQSGEAWILNRFVCPAARLAELSEEITPEDSFPLAIIGSPGTNGVSWQQGLSEDATRLTNWERRHGEVLPVECYEVRPAVIPVSVAKRDLLGFADADVFVELAWDDALIEGLHEISESGWLLAKGRTGGLTAESFPRSEQLARFLHSCFSLELGFKLTAGLHHPFPVKDPSTGGVMHGFVNVLVASSLIVSEDLPARSAALVLASDAQEFEFTDERVVWRGLEASLTDVAAVRDLFAGFGSCSVSEPLEDLSAAGLS